MRAVFDHCCQLQAIDLSDLALLTAASFEPVRVCNNARLLAPDSSCVCAAYVEMEHCGRASETLDQLRVAQHICCSPVSVLTATVHRHTCLCSYLHTGAHAQPCAPARDAAWLPRSERRRNQPHCKRRNQVPRSPRAVEFGCTCFFLCICL